MAIVNSCQNIMDKMDVSNSPRIFGIGADVDVELPYIWHSGEEQSNHRQHANSSQTKIADEESHTDDHKCIMTITTSGLTDVSTWAEMWEAATIATGMCSVQRKKGLYSHIGELGVLRFCVGVEQWNNSLYRSE